jgi:hypothetical protein
MTYSITVQFNFPPTFGWFTRWYEVQEKKPGYSHRTMGFGPVVIAIATLNKWKLE